MGAGIERTVVPDTALERPGPFHGALWRRDQAMAFRRLVCSVSSRRMPTEVCEEIYPPCPVRGVPFQLQSSDPVHDNYLFGIFQYVEKN